MSSRATRQGVIQAGWNTQHSSWFAWHVVITAALVGLLFQSWWVFLLALVLIFGLLELRIGRMLVLGVFTIPWLGLAMLVGYVLGEQPGMWVLGFLGSGAAYVGFKAGDQYFKDLRGFDR